MTISRSEENPSTPNKPKSRTIPPKIQAGQEQARVSSNTLAFMLIYKRKKIGDTLFKLLGV